MTLHFRQVSGSDQTVIVMLTALLVTTALTVGAFAVGLAGFCRRRSARKMRRAENEVHDLPTPFLFDRPGRWMAVKCSQIQKVQATLGVHNATLCPLSEGFARLNDRKLFIAPPIRGWILVVGNSLPDPAEDVDRLFRFLMRVAADLGSVQFFSANRVLNHHAWVRIENSRVYRAYAWAGETIWNQGERTAAERELDLRCFEYCNAPLPFPFTARDSNVANTEKVFQLASRWSVDPMAVNQQNFHAFGITGDPTRR